MNSSFPVAFLTVLAGPLIWAVHFLLIYTVNGVVCARPGMQGHWLGIPLSSWAIIGIGVMALAAMASIYVRRRHGVPPAGAPSFLPWLAGTLSLLSAVAIVWETLPVLFFTPCG